MSSLSLSELRIGSPQTFIGTKRLLVLVKSQFIKKRNYDFDIFMTDNPFFKIGEPSLTPMEPLPNP